MAGSPGDGARAGVVGAVDIAGVAGEVGAVDIAGVAGEADRCRGGQPRLGGAAGVVSALPVCGFRRSTVTAVLPELGTRSLFPGSLSALFLSMDRYRSSAHLANFQVRSSLYCSQKTSGSLSEKSAKTQNRS